MRIQNGRSFPPSIFAFRTLSLSLLLSTSYAGAAETKKVDFFKDVQPVFKASCYGCHGPEQQMVGLRLDQKAAALKGGISGKSILPGKGKASLLLTKITGAAKGMRMPPNMPPLSPETTEMIRLWIDQGAEWPDKPSDPTHGHWAYQPVKRPSVPRVKDAARVRNPIDAFILQRLEKEGLKPSPGVTKEALIRRVSLDLIGLPPSVKEVDTFLADESPNAYAKLVDRLLASPHFGERWARPWLDLARYADSNGYEKDDRRSIWKYRDWVIGALNRNEPFDRFTIDQIAGDMLPNPSLDQRIATGFHRNTLTNEEGGVDREEARWINLVDRVGTTATTWLGSTLACAQCHNHKYDPFSQKDFYSFLAFFEASLEPQLKVPSLGQASQVKSLEAEIARLKARAENPALGKTDAAAMKARIADLEKRLNELPIPTTLVMEEKPDKVMPFTYLRIKGAFLQKGEKVEAATPEVLPALAPTQPRNRLGLANWLVDRRNPLTARVAVNRFWEQLFGQGLVETSEDFGTQGQPPTHPQLLDWLASEYMKGWDTKALLRLIVTSSTYRQSSKVTPKLLEKDPANHLLARGPRFRLEAETIRDVALTASGLLSPKVGGPSVFPPQPEGIWDIPYSGDKWVTSTGEDRYRRGLYTFLRRSSPYPMFLTFDATSREFCTVKRTRTNTPLQALNLLNDESYFEAAGALAGRMEREGGASAKDRLTYGFRLCTSRKPSTKELTRLQSLYARYVDEYAKDAGAAKEITGGKDETAERAALTMVGNVLLNLDETLTKG